MTPGGAAMSVRTVVGAMVAVGLALSLAGSDRLAPPGARPKAQKPLDQAAQAASAETLALAFAGPCLDQPDATAATVALRSAGWPAFRTVWREPASLFYAAPSSPVGLYVIGDRPWDGLTAQRLTCVGRPRTPRRWWAPSPAASPPVRIGRAGRKAQSHRNGASL
jgi:hypothetical protein